MPCELRKPITRRIGRLVVRISEQGVELRGYRRRKRRRATWAQIASLADADHPVVQLAENFEGRRLLETMGVEISSPREPAAAIPNP